MKPPEQFERIINGKRYSVASAELIAGNDYWDGHNFERRGRQCFLYKTANGAFFIVALTQWQGERDTLTPVSEAEAVAMYEGRPNEYGVNLSEHRVTYENAFPDIEITEA